MQPYRRPYSYPRSFASQALARMSYASPRVRTAMALGQFAYDHRTDLFRAAKRISKAARTYSRRRKNKRENFSSSNIGKDIGTADAKRYMVDDTDDNNLYDTRTLYFKNLIDIPTGYFDYQRAGARVNISGIKICTEWYNQYVNDAEQILNCHLAVIAPKDSNCKETQLAISTDFFGAMGGNVSNRATDFSTSLSSNDFRCYPINTDKWVVLKHIRFDLGPRSTIAMPDHYYKHQDFYLKINRQVQFSSNAADATTDNPIFLVWWCDSAMEAGGAVVKTQALRLNTKAVIFFREPR